MKEQDNYPWMTLESGTYYIPDPLSALKLGYFQLEDTGEIFKVTGINENVQPMCLKFERYPFPTTELLSIPVAKKVKP